MLLLQAIWQKYTDIEEWYRAQDPRITHYFLINSPFTIVYVNIAYWLFIRKIGPKIMEYFQPFQLKVPMMIYNLVQIVVNAYLVYLGLRIVFTIPSYQDWSCMLCDKTTKDTLDVDCAYLYAATKVLDLMDTVFMVLRKSYRQITFLHVYHHISMSLIVVFLLPIIGPGHYIIFGIANSFVHTFMYLYYLLSAYSSQVKKSIRWKKKITQLQIAQFILIFVHLMRALINPNCLANKIGLFGGCLQVSIMMVLFTKFYIRAYTGHKKPNTLKSN